MFNRLCSTPVEIKTVEPTEFAYRAHFLEILPKKLRVKHSPSEEGIFEFRWGHGVERVTVNENKAIMHLSQAVFNSKNVQHLPRERQLEKYTQIMLGAYQGDHLLIEDDAAHTFAQKMIACGAIIRGSSHYEKGRCILKWHEGEPLYHHERYDSLIAAEINHYGLSGKHIKHILFHAVHMRETVDGKLIPGMTARQADALAKHNKLKLNGEMIPAHRLSPKVRHFTALQFEASPDCEGNNLRDPLFYTHRLYGFVLYRILKILGFENANIGAYGYGKTDTKPVIIS